MSTTMKLTVNSTGLTSDELKFNLTETVVNSGGDAVENLIGLSRMTIAPTAVENSQFTRTTVASATKVMVYIYNATDSALPATIQISVGAAIVGNLAPGEWAKIPWDSVGSAGDIAITNLDAANEALVEYMAAY